MSFKDDLKINDILELEVNKVARATTINILNGVVLSTPVDTGRARGNWQTSVSSPIESQRDKLDKSGGSTISEGTTFVQSRSKAKYPVFWISNNLPYIEELNRGTSDQAPAKFVESVIKRVANKDIELD